MDAYTIDTQPGVVHVRHYAGQSLSILIRIDAAVVGGRTWKSQIKRSYDQVVADDELTFQNHALGVVATLSAAKSTTLAGSSGYVGLYDVRLGTEGVDPVTYVIQGEFTVGRRVTTSA